VEPDVPAGTLNGGGGTQVAVARLSPSARPLGAAYLPGITRPLLNVPPAPWQAYFHDSFNDKYVYRGQAIVDSVPGALAVQSAFEQADWLGMLRSVELRGALEKRAAARNPREADTSPVRARRLGSDEPDRVGLGPGRGASAGNMDAANGPRSGYRECRFPFIRIGS